MSELVYKWLDKALDWGITEEQFWNMTLAELTRAMSSKYRVKLEDAKQRASFDYTMVDLMARSIGRIYSSATTMPDIATVYPQLFDSKELEELKAQKQAELSALRFRQFADSYNRRFRKEVKAIE